MARRTLLQKTLYAFIVNCFFSGAFQMLFILILKRTDDCLLHMKFKEEKAYKSCISIRTLPIVIAL